jgi:hypothetical protein
LLWIIASKAQQHRAAHGDTGDRFPVCTVLAKPALKEGFTNLYID